MVKMPGYHGNSLCMYGPKHLHCLSLVTDVIVISDAKKEVCDNIAHTSDVC